jgi:3-phenylpropionate/cinnamic acid dioxygenase small subunit
MSPVSLELQASVQAFLYHEARLLDRFELEAWFSLFTEDCRYWVPLLEGQEDGRKTSSIIHDDHTLLDLRVRQYAHPRAHARLPRARTVHHVSNVSVLEVLAGGAELAVASALILIEYRQERQRVFGASVSHRLRRREAAGPGAFGIVDKRVDLVNSEAELDGIAILF